MTDRRPLLRAIFDAAVAAAHPEIVLGRHLPPVPKGRVICLAAGKGAAAMAAAAERHYLDALEMEPSRLTGIAATRHGRCRSCLLVDSLKQFVGNSPGSAQASHAIQCRVGQRRHGPFHFSTTVALARTGWLGLLGACGRSGCDPVLHVHWLVARVSLDSRSAQIRFPHDATCPLRPEHLRQIHGELLH